MIRPVKRIVTPGHSYLATLTETISTCADLFALSNLLTYTEVERVEMISIPNNCGLRDSFNTKQGRWDIEVPRSRS